MECVLEDFDAKTWLAAEAAFKQAQRYQPLRNISGLRAAWEVLWNRAGEKVQIGTEYTGVGMPCTVRTINPISRILTINSFECVRLEMGDDEHERLGELIWDGVEARKARWETLNQYLEQVRDDPDTLAKSLLNLRDIEYARDRAHQEYESARRQASKFASELVIE
jgi:hypothetical protein